MFKLFSRLLLLVLAGSAVIVNAAIIHVDPDAFVHETDISTAFDGIILSSFGSTAGTSIYSWELLNPCCPNAPIPSTGTNVFSHDGPNNITWKEPGTGSPTDPFGFQAEFLSPTSYFSIDVILGNRPPTSGGLEKFKLSM